MSERHDVRPEPLQVTSEPAEEFGLRVDHQSEAVQIEAAEFMVATRSQQEKRLRIARDLETLKTLDDAAP